jgi:hypothetical protein
MPSRALTLTVVVACGVSAIGLIVNLSSAFGVPANFVRRIIWTIVIVTFILFIYSGLRAIYYLIRGSGSPFPSQEALIEEQMRYEIVQATKDDIIWASMLAGRVYLGDDIIPQHVMLDWYKANPHGFSIIKTSSGTRVGNLDILPLKTSTLERFLQGDLIERNITGDCLYSSAERDCIRKLYVESFVALDRDLRPRPNPGAVGATLRSFPNLVSRLCDSLQVESVYAMAASKEGKRMLTDLGFQAICGAKSRRDGHDMYCAEYSKLRERLSGFTDRKVSSAYQTTDPSSLGAL